MPARTDDMQGLARKLVEPLRAWLVPQDGWLLGAFTPQVVGSTTAGTFTYSEQSGTYARIGPVCLFSIGLVITTVAGGPAGNTTITGLPFTCAARRYTVPVEARLNLSAGYSWVIGTLVSSDVVTLVEMGDTTRQGFPAASLAANDIIRCTGWYEVA